MTRQEMVDHDVRQALGELTVQVILLRAELAEAKEQLFMARQEQPPPEMPVVRGNGKAKEANP